MSAPKQPGPDEANVVQQDEHHVGGAGAGAGGTGQAGVEASAVRPNRAGESTALPDIASSATIPSYPRQPARPRAGLHSTGHRPMFSVNGMGRMLGHQGKRSVEVVAGDPTEGADVRRVGIIGLGNMGRPIARNVLRGGYEVAVYDLHPSAVQSLVDDGAMAAARPGTSHSAPT